MSPLWISQRRPWASGMGGSECRAVSQWLLTSSLAPFLKPALVRKGPLGASCFYGFKTRASEEGPSMKKKKANKVRIKENKQLEGRHCLRFLILKFLYFSFDFLWELWRHVSQTDSMLEEESYKGEGGRAGGHMEKKKKKTHAKENELEQRCFENNCQVRWVWSKVYWCCVWGKIIKKGQNKTVDSNQSHK